MSPQTTYTHPAIARLAEFLRRWEPHQGNAFRRAIERMPLFWRFQIAGWTAWTIWAMPLKFAHYNDLGTAFWLGLLHEVCGFLITLGLREIYNRFGLAELDIWILAPVLVLISTASASVDLVIARGVQDFLSIGGDDVSEANYSGYLFCLRTLLFVAWSALYFSIKGLLETREKSRQLVEAERLRHDAELQMLRSQTNPHFLFNAFNTILSEGRGNPKVVDLVKALSDYLRYSLACRHEGFVSLGAEIDAITSYLEVEKARFQGDLILEIQVTQMARSAGVPGVIIQPLVENAIKYGRETCEFPLRVRIAAETGPHALRIEVSNSGRWIPQRPWTPNQASGSGLDNLRRRLESIYPGTHRFEIEEKGGEVVALVEIEMSHDYDTRLQNYELRQRMEPS